MTESDMYQDMRRLLKPLPIKLQRIEYPTVPDLYFRHKNGGGWIELKIIRTTGKVIKIPFRPGQFPWIQEEVRLNGTVYLFCVDQDECFYVYKNKDIQRDYTTHDLLEKSVIPWDAPCSTEWNDIYPDELFSLLGGKN